MSTIVEYTTELDAVVDALDELAINFEVSLGDKLRALEAAVDEIEHSWSRSNLGYQARVYYDGFRPPPAGEMFSAVDGVARADDDLKFLHANQHWIVYSEDDVRAHVLAQAGDVDLPRLQIRSDAARGELSQHKAALLSILTSCLMIRADSYLLRIEAEVAESMPPSAQTFARSYVGESRTIRTNDSIAASQGTWFAPHQTLRGEAKAIGAPFVSARVLANKARNAAAHLRRLPGEGTTVPEQGDRVFIGHGGSMQWRDLKDYIHDRLGLPVEEFNRVPVAGFTTVARLTEMLDNAAMAFLVMTAEDETPEGGHRARQNVVHEVGLFQGRLGFDKAIVMLEEGCQDFSNIHGLSQVRYPRGNISAKFHEVHELLKREKLL